MFETQGCVPIQSDRYPLLMQVPNTETAIQWALSYLGCNKLLCKKPCVCLDIDGTVLINHKNGSSSVVCHFRSFVDTCKQNGISILYVTARPDEPENRRWTEKQLIKCGLHPIEKLYMRPPKASYDKYKFQARSDIIKNGYTILISIGDQFADVSMKSPGKEIQDDKTYVGMLGDKTNVFSIKLPSEYIDTSKA